MGSYPPFTDTRRSTAPHLNPNNAYDSAHSDSYLDWLYYDGVHSSWVVFVTSQLALIPPHISYETLSPKESGITPFMYHAFSDGSHTIGYKSKEDFFLLNGPILLRE